ncbi:MAG: hypothetical protein IJ587_04880 [Synergistaceae bacterium]|nr:hypothetical protein [Synergistaceae bacterium]
MSKFTEGKWRVLYFPEILGIVDEDNDPIQLNEANARLIAAAPEMYDELYEVLQLLKGKSSYDGDEFDQQAKSIQELFARIDGKEAKDE